MIYGEFRCSLTDVSVTFIAGIPSEGLISDSEVRYRAPLFTLRKGSRSQQCQPAGSHVRHAHRSLASLDSVPSDRHNLKGELSLLV